MKKYLILLLVCAAAAFAVACGSVYEKEAVGIGTDYSELKKSPCACMKLDQVPALPMWFS